MRSIPVTPVRRVNAAVVFVAIVAMFVVGARSPVGAHTDFDYSLPADGETVGAPVSEVTVAFTLPVTLVGNGFEVLDPQENLLMPVAVTDDDTLYRLQFDPPLAGGAVGVRYTVTAEDGHVLSGSFAFTVSAAAPPPTTTTVAPATLPPVTEPPATQPPAATEPTTVVPTTVAPTTVAPTTTVTVATSATGSTAADADDSSNSGLVVAIAAIVAVAAAGLVLVRSRRSSDS